MRMAIFRFLAALSLLCCMTTIALWVRNQWVSDRLQWHQTDLQANTWRGYEVSASRASLWVSRQYYVFERPGSALRKAQDLKRVSGFQRITYGPKSPRFFPSIWSRLGFWLYAQPLRADPFSSESYRCSVEYAAVPHWFLALLFACGGSPCLLPVYARWRAARLSRANRCKRCGYDLRATPNQCPECGTPAVAMTQT